MSGAPPVTDAFGHLFEVRLPPPHFQAGAPATDTKDHVSQDF
jgi:hypothetical protein